MSFPCSAIKLSEKRVAPWQLPTAKSLQVELADLLTAYAELKKVCNELKKLTVHKANYEELRDFEEREKRKEKEHGRE